MIITVYKCPIGIDTQFDCFVIDMPEGAKTLSVQMLHNVPCIWAMVDTEKVLAPRTFIKVGIGCPIEEKPEDLRLIGTLQPVETDLLFHLFELVN